MIRDVRIGAAIFLVSAAVTLPTIAQAILLATAWMLPHLLPSVFTPATPQRQAAWYRFQLFAVLFVVASVIIQGVFGPEPRLPIPFVQLSGEGLERGLAISLRAILILTGVLAIVLPMQPLQLAEWLTRFRLPVGIPVAILLSLQLVEELPETINRIRGAQRSRGLQLDGPLPIRLRAARFLITPVVMRSLEGSLERATALQLRGLLTPTGQERLPLMHPTAGTFLLGLAFILLLTRVLQWLGYLPSIA
ncbi:MAG: energy-coupling factor transporter transmembrane protein EcfT [Bacteroidetes bacterium]|jgi:energy-coupling factor transporter transmembrane protein EcfT|nr:energy-coupling factor transporter transmembrane protein EcfT [Bacteroidota bacterium]